MKKKLMAVLLCFAMAFTLIPVAPTQAYGGDSLSICCNGEPVDHITLPQNERIQLTVSNEQITLDDYQWQILSGSSQWVDIAGANHSSLDLSYAMVASLLANDEAQIRCRGVSKGTDISSPSVRVRVDYEAVPVFNQAAAIPVEQLVVSEAAPVGEAIIVQGESDLEDLSAEPSEKEPTVDETEAEALEPNAEEEQTVEMEHPAAASSTYSIMIQYVFSDGKQAANPWTAVVAEGSSFQQEISSPTVLGYTPDQERVILDYTNISADQTVTVTYSPALVEYTVVHHQQNLYDDGYTEVERTVKEGYTESPVGDQHANAYDGFYSLLYDGETEIAADGSTIVEIYYDRYYYLINFNLDGGYGVEPIYARYGTPLDVGTPSKAGYTFVGWNNTIPSTMPVGGGSFEAIWQSGNVTYDVVFWYENADDDGYSQAGSLEDVSAQAGEIVNGSAYQSYDFIGKDSEHFTYSHGDENVTVKGDGSTTVNVYFKRNVYQLTYVMGRWAGSCTLEEHRHSDSCRELVCSKQEHQHTSSCALICQHTHTLQCYKSANNLCYLKPGNPEQSIEPNRGNGVYSYTTGNLWWGETHYYLYLNGTWYCCYENGTSGEQRNDTIDILKQCTHAHTEDCYSCGKVEHIHDTKQGCYQLSCGKYEHYHKNGTCYLLVTEKYDANIADVWERNPVKGVVDAGYVFRSSITGQYYSFLEKMPGKDITMTKSSFGGYERYTWSYYLEVLPGQDTTGLTIRKDQGKTYYLYHTSSVIASGLNLTYEEDYFPITGFTQRDKDVPLFDENKEAYLYYTRNRYNLSFSNHGSIVANHGGTFLFEEDISRQDFIPDYPENLEPGAYVFDGWYRSPFFGDTKFEFTTVNAEGTIVGSTMPANDLSLYAHWVPKKHTVDVYLTREMNESEKLCPTQVIPHGSTATEPAEPVNGGYTFVGWFYMDGTTEKAFDFSMPVNKDLSLYAKWSSNVLMNYTIHYQTADGTTIAADTTGSALAGNTKTFEAKVGEDLYEGYEVGYFPMTNSHSLTVDIDDPKKNEFTFIYVPKEEIPYTVKYLEFGTGNVLHQEKNAVTRNAVVTEHFEAVAGYMPDAYQKRLILSADEGQNVIIFWYVKDDIHAPVQIIHYVQNPTGNGYTEYQSYTDLNGVIGEAYRTNLLNIPGFVYDRATANKVPAAAEGGTVSGEVTDSGLILELYYDRKLYPYAFQFLELGTNQALADPVIGTARYGSQITENAKMIPGYHCKDSALAMTIQMEDGSEAVKNIRTFYYTEEEVSIKYEAVGPVGETGFGSVSPAEEHVKVFSGNAVGAIPIPADGYRFAGWYYDRECTKPVAEEGWLNGERILPQKTKDYGGAGESKLGYEQAVYYAKFEHHRGDLRIEKTGAEPIDENQSFIFSVVGDADDPHTAGVDLKAVITIRPGQTAGNITIKDLPIGHYVVTEASDWSWRYTPDKASLGITLHPTQVNQVSFRNIRSDSQWLNGAACSNNKFQNQGD